MSVENRVVGDDEDDFSGDDDVVVFEPEAPPRDDEDEKRGADSDDGRERWRSDHREEGHVPHVREVVSPSGM